MTRARQLVGFAAVALVSASATAQEPPRLKPGLWEVKNEMGAGPRGPMSMSFQMCHDAQSQRRHWSPAEGGQGQRCDKVTTRREGAAFVVDAQCHRGERVMQTRMTTTMQGDTAYRTEVVVQGDGPKGAAPRTMVMTGNFVGPCPAGMKPGDRKMQGGPGMPPGR